MSEIARDSQREIARASSGYLEIARASKREIARASKREGSCPHCVGMSVYERWGAGVEYHFQEIS